MVIFSPGNGATRLLYSAIAQELASRGSTVVVIDHTYNSAVVEFPNGHVIYGVADNYTTVEQILQAWVETYAHDISFMLDCFGFSDSADAMRAAVMGHSLGGAVARTVLRDRRVQGIVILDGHVTEQAQNSTVGSAGREQAAVLWQQEPLNDTPGQVVAYARFKDTMGRSAFVDFFAHVKLKSAKHYAFLDKPLLFDISGLNDDEKVRDPIVKSFGTISGKRYLEVMGLYTHTFVEYLFGRKGELSIDIYSNPPDDFSEVERVS